MPNPLIRFKMSAAEAFSIAERAKSAGLIHIPDPSTLATAGHREKKKPRTVYNSTERQRESARRRYHNNKLKASG